MIRIAVDTLGSDNGSKDIVQGILDFLKAHNDVQIFAVGKKEELTEFNDKVFNSVIEKVIIGEKYDDGSNNPYMVSFIFTGGFITKVDLTKDRHIKRLLEIRKYREQNKS